MSKIGDIIIFLLRGLFCWGSLSGIRLGLTQLFHIDQYTRFRALKKEIKVIMEYKSLKTRSFVSTTQNFVFRNVLFKSFFSYNCYVKWCIVCSKTVSKTADLQTTLTFAYFCTQYSYPTIIYNAKIINHTDIDTV